MLLKLALSRHFSWIWIVISLSVQACRQSPKPISEEETALLADYEKPEAQWGFINKEGEMVIQPRFDDVSSFSEGLAAVNQNGYWGYIDQSGKLVIQCNFQAAWGFHDHRARIKAFDQNACFISRNGSLLKSDDWIAADDFHSGLARVTSGNRSGYIDTSGKMIVKPIFTRGGNFQSGLCVVQFNEKSGVINPDGNFILQAKYDHIKITSSGHLILCSVSDTSFVFNSKGRVLMFRLDCKMEDASGNVILLKEKEKYFQCDLASQKILNDQGYDEIIDLGNSIWSARSGDKYLMLDFKGQVINSNGYQQINKFSEGFAAYSKDGYWGYLDSLGSEKTKPEFGLAWDYKEGVARVAFKDGIGFINDHQQLAFYPPAGAIEMKDFAEGMAAVRFNTDTH